MVFNRFLHQLLLFAIFPFNFFIFHYYSSNLYLLRIFLINCFSNSITEESSNTVITYQRTYRVIYVYCSNALYNHSTPSAFSNIVAPIIKSNVCSSRNFGTTASEIKNTAYTIADMSRLINNNSCTARVNSSLLSLTFAHNRIP